MTGGYKGLQEVQEVAASYKRLGGYKGLQKTYFKQNVSTYFFLVYF